MNQTKAIKINHFDPQSRQLVLSQEPLVSSSNLGWQDFNFDYYQYGSYETPVHTTEHHAIGLALDSIISERRLDGVSRHEQQNWGSVAVIPAGVEHYSAWKSSGKFIVLSFTPQALADIAPETVNPDKIELLPTFAQPEPDNLIASIGMGIKQQLESDPDGSDFYVQYMNNALFAHLLKNYCTIEHSLPSIGNGLSPYKLKQAISYINDNLNQKIKPTDVAEVVDISQYNFCRQFHDSTGVSLYRYLIQQRVAKAKDLMKNPNLSLVDIAGECGFSSQSQMTQHFRKSVGVTPKVYRNKL